MDKFHFSVAVGAGFPVTYPGTYVRYREATSGIDYPEILVKTDTGDQVKLLPGQGFTFARRFGSINVENSDAAATIVGELIVGDGSFEDNRIQGEVSISDISKSRSLAGTAFLLHQYCSAVAAQYAHAQLWNPSGSGKNLILAKAKIFCTTAGAYYVGRKAAALATAGSTPFPKLIGGSSVSVGLGKKENNVAAQLSNEFSFVLGANTFPTALPIGDDVIIPPGQGWGVYSGTVNTDIGLQCDYYEDPV